MADLKPAYLVSGEDDAKIDSWRGRVRARAEAERGPGGLEVFDGAANSPEEVAAALATLSFETGVRYLLVDHAEAWKAAQLEPLTAALGAMPPETTLVLIVRGKPLKQLAKAVEGAGGETRNYAAPKPWELPKWAIERAREEGVQLAPDAAKQLVSQAGGGQHRLARELEKLALAVHPATEITLEDVERLAAVDAAPGAYELADALTDADLSRALGLAEGIAAQGPPGAVLWRLAQRLREVHRAAALLEAGMSEADAAKTVSRQPWLAKKIMARAKQADRPGLERAICVLAELELDLRGGGKLTLDEPTAFDLALTRAVSA